MNGTSRLSSPALFLPIFAILFAFAVVEVASADIVTWVGISANARWNETDDWYPHIPTHSDIVIISLSSNANSSMTMVLPENASLSLNQLWLDNKNTKGHSLFLQGNKTKVELDNLQVSGNVIVVTTHLKTTLNCTSGNFVLRDSTMITQHGGQSIVDSCSIDPQNSVIFNHGNLTMLPASGVSGEYAGNIVNYGNLIFESHYDHPTIFVPNFENEGTLELREGSWVMFYSMTWNGGVMNLRGATLRLLLSFQNQRIINADNSTIFVDGDFVNYSYSTLNLTQSSVIVEGTLRNSGLIALLQSNSSSSTTGNNIQADDGLFNYRSIYIQDGVNLQISGDYSQYDASVNQKSSIAFDVHLPVRQDNNYVQPIVAINGQATFAGSIVLNFTNQLHNLTSDVNVALFGYQSYKEHFETMSENLNNGLQAKYDLSYETSYLYFKVDTPSHKSLTWLWVLIGIVGFVLLVVAVIFTRRRYKRTAYTNYI